MTRPDLDISPEMQTAQPTTENAPIFIIGIMPRSGTNFLHRLICQHPECGAINTTPVREDYLLHHGHLLHVYLKRLRWQWGHWGADSQFVVPLFSNVGKGLSNFLATLTEAKRFVTKTPSVHNISQFFELFPHAYLLIIVRDGRSVVASGMSGFGWNFETATREWARAANEVLKFTKKNEAYAHRFRLVQYESLNENTVGELESIFAFLGLNPEDYDFNAALDTPIYGSSYMKEEGKKVTWAPQVKSEDFGKRTRWASWTASQHRRFNRLAGKELQALGYEQVDQSVNGMQAGMLAMKDGVYAAKITLRKLKRAVTSSLRTFRDEMLGQTHTKTDLKK